MLLIRSYPLMLKLSEKLPDTWMNCSCSDVAEIVNVTNPYAGLTLAPDHFLKYPVFGSEVVRLTRDFPAVPTLTIVVPPPLVMLEEPVTTQAALYVVGGT